MSVTYLPSEGRLALVTGLSAARGTLHPDDPLGIVHFSSIMMEIPFLVNDPSDGFDFNSSDHSLQYYTDLLELCLRYLNRLVYVVRFCTGRYWIKSISLDSLFLHEIIEENDDDKGRRQSSIYIPTGRPFEWNVREQSEVQVMVDELLSSGSRISISENLFLEALNYYYHSDLTQAVITANTSLEVFVMDDMIRYYVKTGKGREEALDHINKSYKTRFQPRFKKHYFGSQDVSGEPIMKKVNDVRNARKLVVHPFLRTQTPEEVMRVLMDIREIKLWIGSKGGNATPS